MRARFISTTALAAFLPATFASPTSPYSEASFKPQDIITRDVAVIGGGSSGIYSAIQLLDKGKSVVVVEKKDRVGGHTETYIDPSGKTIDMGVIVFHNTTLVRDYFTRLRIPFIVANGFGGGEPRSYDLRTGEAVTLNRPNQTAVGAAFAKYAQVFAKYPKLNEGLFLPDPVPDELVLPLYDFLKKYGAEDALPTMFQFNAGMGDVFKIPAVENIRAWGLDLIAQLSGGFLTTARQNNSELYTNAASELNKSNSLFLKSEVVFTERSDTRVTLVISTPTGLKLIKAKKLLITIPPRIENLRPFALRLKEKQLFERFSNTGYTTNILNNTGIPDNVSITNAAQNTIYNLPPFPGLYDIGATSIPGLKTAYLGTNKSKKFYPLTDAQNKKIIIDSIKILQNTYPHLYKKTEPYFVAYSNHAPFHLQVTAEEIKAGFYKKMYALQGQRRTWWTGATWRAHDSSSIWKYTHDYVLPGLIKGL